MNDRHYTVVVPNEQLEEMANDRSMAENVASTLARQVSERILFDVMALSLDEWETSHSDVMLSTYTRLKAGGR